MNKKQLSQFRKQLEVLRAQLGQELQQLSESNLNKSQRESTGDLSGYSYHMADVGTDNFGREMELNIASSGNERLRLIEEAIERVDEGSFGKCLSCGAEIHGERLKAIPYTRLCIDCARESEKKY
jgi:RNA polymerase-binding protein DksA